MFLFFFCLLNVKSGKEGNKGVSVAFVFNSDGLTTARTQEWGPYGKKQPSSKGHESPAMREVTAGVASRDPQQKPLASSDPTCILLLLPAPGARRRERLAPASRLPGQPSASAPIRHQFDTSANLVTDGAERTPGHPHPAHRHTGATPEPRW